MPLHKLNTVLAERVRSLEQQGISKATERIIERYIPPKDSRGARYGIRGYQQAFIRLNTNSYLGLSNHSALVEAADKATHEFGVGPGAVRFIDGTHRQHVDLEKVIANFTNYPVAKIFNSAYTANLALALSLASPQTYWISDALNHNSIIRSMRIANIPSSHRAVFAHNDMESLRTCLEQVPAKIKTVCIIFDGVFSMRGDIAPVKFIQEIAEEFHDKFDGGVVTIMDDSHGIGAYGERGKGTVAFAQTQPDITTGTFGKAFGVNGGFIAGSTELAELVRQQADTYIYTNPLSVADCAAACASILLLQSEEGKNRLQMLQRLTQKCRSELLGLGYETIGESHPIIPLLIRDKAKTKRMVQQLFDAGILVVGLTFPVVPKGDETIRLQINASLTDGDIDEIVQVFEVLKNE